MLKAAGTAFTRFLDDGRICLTNNAAERSPARHRPRQKGWLFAGSDRGGERAAFMYCLIATAKLNDVDPQAWLADVLARIAEPARSRACRNCCRGTGGSTLRSGKPPDGPASPTSTASTRSRG